MNLEDLLTSCMESYWDHLRRWTSVDAVDNRTAVLDLPYLDCHNDAIQVIVTKTDDGVLRLSDGEWTLTDLEQSGCPIDTARRRELLNTILNVNSISESEGELYVVTDESGFAHALESLTAAMLRASEIQNTVTMSRRRVFRTDVSGWLRSIGLHGVCDTRMRGTSGFEYRADFLVTGTIGERGTILQTVPKPNADTLAKVIVMGNELRSEVGRVCAIVDDSGLKRSASERVDSLAERHGLDLIHWSNRDEDVGRVLGDLL